MANFDPQKSYSQVKEVLITLKEIGKNAASGAEAVTADIIQQYRSVKGSDIDPRVDEQLNKFLQEPNAANLSELRNWLDDRETKLKTAQTHFQVREVLGALDEIQKSASHDEVGSAIMIQQYRSIKGNDIDPWVKEQADKFLQSPTADKLKVLKDTLVTKEKELDGDTQKRQEQITEIFNKLDRESIEYKVGDNFSEVQKHNIGIFKEYIDSKGSDIDSRIKERYEDRASENPVVGFGHLKNDLIQEKSRIDKNHGIEHGKPGKFEGFNVDAQKTGSIETNKNKITAEELHTFSALMHLPYDADKLSAEKQPNLAFAQGEHTHINIPEGSNKDNYFKFKGHNGEAEYYKKISQTQSLDESHDSAAFVQIDKNGNHVLQPDGKQTVVVVFAGLNDIDKDFHNGIRDMRNTSSFSAPFYEQVERDLRAGAAKEGIQNIDSVNLKATGHSMGDKYAIEFAGIHVNAKIAVLDGWDTKDSLAATAIRQTLIDTEGAQFNEVQFKKNVAANLDRLQSNVIDVRFSDARKENLTDNSYVIEGAKHRVANGLYVDESRIKDISVETGRNEVLEHAIIKREAVVLEALKVSLKSDGEYSREDKKLFHAAKDLLKSGGATIGELQEVAFATYGDSKAKDLLAGGKNEGRQ